MNIIESIKQNKIIPLDKLLDHYNMIQVSKICMEDSPVIKKLYIINLFHYLLFYNNAEASDYLMYKISNGKKVTDKTINELNYETFLQIVSNDNALNVNNAINPFLDSLFSNLSEADNKQLSVFEKDIKKNYLNYSEIVYDYYFKVIKTYKSIRPLDNIKVINVRGRDELNLFISSLKVNEAYVDPILEKLIKYPLIKFYETPYVFKCVYYPIINSFQLIYIYKDLRFFENDNKFGILNNTYAESSPKEQKETININNKQYPVQLVEEMLEVSLEGLLINLEIENSLNNG